LGGHELAAGDELDRLGEVSLPTAAVLVALLVAAMGPFVVLRVVVGVALREYPVDGIVPVLRHPLPPALAVELRRGRRTSTGMGGG
jgi:hypothetical protein